jgi:hypothetical protein
VPNSARLFNKPEMEKTMQIKVEPEDRPLFELHTLDDIANTVGEVLGEIWEVDDDEGELPKGEYAFVSPRNGDVLLRTLDILDALKRAVIAARKPERVP